MHPAANEEEVVEFVLEGWSAGNASQSATGFQTFLETRYIPITEKSERSLTTQDLSGLAPGVFRDSSIDSCKSSVLTVDGSPG